MEQHDNSENKMGFFFENENRMIDEKSTNSTLHLVASEIKPVTDDLNLMKNSRANPNHNRKNKKS